MDNDRHIIHVGDFITVPAWKAFGQVIDTKPSMFGSEYSQSVLLQTSPDDDFAPLKARWYRLEPNEFHFED